MQLTTFEKVVPISFKHVSLWCLFFDPYLPIHQSNSRCPIKKSNQNHSLTPLCLLTFSKAQANLYEDIHITLPLRKKGSYIESANLALSPNLLVHGRHNIRAPCLSCCQTLICLNQVGENSLSQGYNHTVLADMEPECHVYKFGHRQLNNVVSTLSGSTQNKVNYSISFG